MNDREARDLGSIMYVVSIANPTSPAVIAVLPLGLTGNGRGSGHIANFVKPDCSQAWVDSTGTVWSVGGGGAAGYRLTANPLAPQLLATTGTAGRNPSPYNDFILHNSQRRGKTLLITEEDDIDTDEVRPAQVGYYIPANGSTWAAYWSPTDPNGEIVYTADAYRGIDVLRIDGGGLTGKKVKAPVRNEWFGSPTADSTSFQAHPYYGFMCTVLKPEVDTP